MQKIVFIFMALVLAPLVMTVHSPPATAQFSDTHHFLNAVKDNDIAGARERIFNGANVNTRRDGVPALIMAAKARYYDMMRLLLESGALPNIKTEGKGETALMVVSVSGDEAAVNILLEFNANVNATDRQGRTALMKAAAARKSRVDKLLIANGADVYRSDYTGRDTLQYAEEARARAVIKILKEAMASEPEGP